MSNFNSKEYSWSSVGVSLLGRPLTGIQGVSYKSTQNKETIYGRGNKPLAIQKGNKSYEGEIKILQSELEALTRASGKGKDIMDLPAFDITITYGDGTNLVTDVMKGCEFTESAKSIEQENTHMGAITLPIICLDINKNK